MSWNPLRHRHRPEPWKGLAAGLAGGLAGTLAMGTFHAVAAAATRRRTRREEGDGQPWIQAEPELAPDRPDAVTPRSPDTGLAEVHARGALAVRYGLGTSFGALYGLACEWHRDLGLAGGAPLGAAVMLLTDEVALPVAKLSPPPLRVPRGAHIEALASHVVYGVVCEATRRRVRDLLD
jgi:putative membrane protein